MIPADRRASLSPALRLLIVAVAYYASARLGLRLALVGDIVTPLWPPTGVAVVALMAAGISMWPAVALAAFAVNAPIAATPLAAATIAVGNTLAPLVAVALLRRFGFDARLVRLRDAMLLVVVALVSMTISASIGTAVVSVTGTTAGTFDTWWVWWAGDAMGVLIVAPLFWSLARVRRRRLEWRRVLEASVLFVALTILAVFASRTKDGLLFVVFPLLGWIAWRFQQVGAAPAGLIASTMVILAATDNRGVFSGDSLSRKMAVLQAFNASVALMSLVFAAAVTERRRFLEALYQREHRIAETLQRSLLPELPTLPGVALAARYLPASEESEVAGDWYDVIPLAGGKLGLVVGDVVGHGISAAAAMAQLRIGLRTYALACRGPAATVRDVNRMAVDLHPGTMATLVYAEFDPATGELRFTSAGHPSPLLVSPSGEARYLEGGHGVPIGVSPEIECEETVQHVPEGSTLILFTDGLVERRQVPIDESLEELRRTSAIAERDIETFCDRITDNLPDGSTTDDVAVLVLRPTSLAGEVLRLRRPATPAAVGDVRQTLRRWLHANGATEDEIYDVLVACSEAQTNAVRHAYRNPDGVVEVEASISNGRVTVIVRDQGTWREPAPISDDDGGRGLPLIGALMDIRVHSNAQGTEVRMHRRLSSYRSEMKRAMPS